MSAADVENAIEVLSDHEAGYTDVYGEPDEPRTPTGRRRPSHAGVPITIPEAVLIEAHRLHLDEHMSIRKLADHFFDDCYSASRKALANSLHNAFRQRGWETLSRTEQMARKNRNAVAHLPRCEHNGCARRTSKRWCWHHRPENIAAGIARLRNGDAA